MRESDRMADWLHKNGWAGIATLVLDAIGPFRTLGAQAMYVIQPFIGGKVNMARDLAVILEDQRKVDDLISKLRDEAEEND
jgi:hypothetical protein